MIALIKNNLEALKSLCIQYAIVRLEVFGSAAEGTFQPGKSDIDFLVEFKSMTPGEHADAFFGFLEATENLLKNPIDLVEPAPIRNPYFLQKINQTKVVLYAAA